MHQGNNRMVIDQSGSVKEVNHYYSFGGLFGEGMQASNQPYRYDGKEFDRRLTITAGFIFYVPILLLWTRK